MKAAALAVVFVCCLATYADAQELTEPSSGARFALKKNGLSLLGVALRTRTIFKVKIYAVGLYVADAALSGPLARHRSGVGSALYSDLVGGDFPKEIHLKFVRDLDRDTIQQAMREAFADADRARIETFSSYFPAIKAGDECVIRWGAGGVIDTTVAGEAKPAIADRNFAAAVFAVWLGPRPIQESIKRGLTSRASELLR